MATVAQGFDAEEAKRFLRAREETELADQEQERKTVLERVIAILKEELGGTGVEVFLVGSVVKAFGFSSHSDVDIVLKGYRGDRFELWPQLEKKIGRTVEIIPFESCHFQDFVIKEGFKVL